jgi:hypothetical protein
VSVASAGSAFSSVVSRSAVREETNRWLQPLLIAAEQRGVDLVALRTAATMPAAEPANPAIRFLGGYAELLGGLPADPIVSEVDWVRFGQLLRHELGMDDTYPAFPDFPEARDAR